MLPLKDVDDRLPLLLDVPLRPRLLREPLRPPRPRPALLRPAVLSVSALVVVPATETLLVLIVIQTSYVVGGPPSKRTVIGDEVDLSL